MLAIPLTVLAAPAVPVHNSGIEGRSNWHHSKTHKVTVGAWSTKRYHPEYVHAKVGDYIEFEFHTTNHSVTESFFDGPCARLTDSNENPIGFDTGLVPVPSTQISHFPTRKYKVTDKKPHWFSCGDFEHCSAGMVFAVNPPKRGNTFRKFKQNALESEEY
ncbi:hypothetical protein RhiJN_05488 [Ceratobasidium sp. AG-Ba]|nr:hypothetical protein RhiJN_05488 [Ceratobasidium sp. AG-Ba]